MSTENIDWSKSKNLYGNTNINCPNDIDDDKYKYVWTTDASKYVNPNCHYQKVSIPDGQSKL